MTQKPEVTGFFDPRTWSIQYVAADPTTKTCAIIDPVYDFDETSGQTAPENADRILEFIASRGYTVAWINTNGGRLPEPESNGMRYLKIPLDLRTMGLRR
jgi:glyoxylase-like metal-dependent hydrolase (beta-lactamase superfamily II)